MFPSNLLLKQINAFTFHHTHKTHTSITANTNINKLTQSQPKDHKTFSTPKKLINFKQRRKLSLQKSFTSDVAGSSNLRNLSQRRIDFNICNSNSVFVFARKRKMSEVQSKINYDFLFSNEQSLVNDNVLSNMARSCKERRRLYPKSSRGYRNFTNSNQNKRDQQRQRFDLKPWQDRLSHDESQLIYLDMSKL